MNKIEADAASHPLQVLRRLLLGAGIKDHCVQSTAKMKMVAIHIPNGQRNSRRQIGERSLTGGQKFVRENKRQQ